MKNCFFSFFLILSFTAYALSSHHSIEQEQSLSGREIIDNYIATQEVASELVYIHMELYSKNLSIEKYQFLILSSKNPDGTRNNLIRLINPKEVMGVALLTLELADDQLEQFYYLPEVPSIR